MAKDTPSAANIRAYASIVRENSVLRQLAEVFPLTHTVRFVRAFCLAGLHGKYPRMDAAYLIRPELLWDAAYIIVFVLLMSYLAVTRLKKRLID